MGLNGEVRGRSQDRDDFHVAVENLMKIVRALRRTLADVARDARL